MITIDGVWKEYKLGNTIDLNKTFREALTQRISKTAKQKTKSEVFWALQDINLSIDSGKTLGLIGHNGAGKSTLLKVLSRITKPTKGSITIHGSLSSLLEVGTGFHPELSGRENIYLYGSIMGMSRRDIDLRFDQIVDYAGIEKFLDTPVKRYSSGMYVRLAFSIAAHVEPDILVVDEVLAVGDKEFRDKCLGKMDDVAQSGRTVIFVSHNMASVASLCQEVAWLDQGRVVETGKANSIISAYENSFHESSASDRLSRVIKGPLSSKLTLESLRLNEVSDVYSARIDHSEDLNIEIQWNASEALKGLSIYLVISVGEQRLMTLVDTENGADIRGRFKTTYSIPAKHFRNADLELSIDVLERSTGEWCWAKDIARVNITSEDGSHPGYAKDALLPIGSASRQKV